MCRCVRLVKDEMRVSRAAIADCGCRAACHELLYDVTTCGRRDSSRSQSFVIIRRKQSQTRPGLCPSLRPEEDRPCFQFQFEVVFSFMLVLQSFTLDP